MDRMRLGGLLLERARYTGDERDLARAESLARESLALRTAHNASACRLLAVGAPGSAPLRRGAGGGRGTRSPRTPMPSVRARSGARSCSSWAAIAAADSVFGALAVRRTDPAVSARYARWLEIRGHAGDARELLERARRGRRARRGASLDQLAWFDLRLGDLALSLRQLPLARQHAERGLSDAFPGDWRLLALAARIELADGPAVARDRVWRLVARPAPRPRDTRDRGRCVARARRLDAGASRTSGRSRPRREARPGAGSTAPGTWRCWITIAGSRRCSRR